MRKLFGFAGEMMKPEKAVKTRVDGANLLLEVIVYALTTL